MPAPRTPRFSELRGDDFLALRSNRRRGLPQRLPLAIALMLPVFDAADAAAQTEEITVTARRKSEALSEVPLSVTALDGDSLAATQVFNVGRLEERVPALQFYSSNPRNTALNLRGMGSPFGLTNDGIEQGVGLYIDDIYHARIASTTFDFIDVERIEILRGPQGTLYGKNTTAGAINIHSRRPGTDPGFRARLTAGNLGLRQLEGVAESGTGKVGAGSLAFSATGRDGLLRNVRTDQRINELDNQGLKGTWVLPVSDTLEMVLGGDINQQSPRCCTQVYYATAPTQRSENRQFDALAGLFEYQVPSRDPYDRLVDNDTAARAEQEFGGVSVKLTRELDTSTITAISAWRFWDWKPSSDRDFTGLPITTLSANPSQQEQLSQELRWAFDVTDRISATLGAFAFHQTIDSQGVQEQGAAASGWLLGPAWADRPEILDGLRRDRDIRYENSSGALYGQLSIDLDERWTLQPGLRLNMDRKEVDYQDIVTSGLTDPSPEELAQQDRVLRSLAYASKFSDSNVSGDISLSYRPREGLMLYANYARAFKSAGLNLSGIPTVVEGLPALEFAQVDPEIVDLVELGARLTLDDGQLSLSSAVFHDRIEDYQTNVVNGAAGLLRGFLANADRVEISGLELEATMNPADSWTLALGYAYTDAEYASFAEAPPPLELSGGGISSVDLSGEPLPGVSKHAITADLEMRRPVDLGFGPTSAFLRVNARYRSRWSSSPSASGFMWVDDNTLVNATLGVDLGSNATLSLWGRNVFDEKYMTLLSDQGGSTGMINGIPGDPRSWGATLEVLF
ncbi:TonB-dependent receptor [Chromatocurvus halotolerans]|uniref:Iron complex outermembrane receptor protein n=1 Tax=Chromatocurvus halotolerans TaxID=1132028 RepID=A0A4R2KZE0_9GAMM|nr:TonB-dependent receptor [Chromatocurvus halotolerans]TCO78572.1 iron complex outermembrane receptor protein [Chromatocurvus halotolerans]